MKNKTHITIEKVTGQNAYEVRFVYPTYTWTVLVQAMWQGPIAVDDLIRKAADMIGDPWCSDLNMNVG